MTHTKGDLRVCIDGDGYITVATFSDGGADIADFNYAEPGYPGATFDEAVANANLFVGSPK